MNQPPPEHQPPPSEFIPFDPPVHPLPAPLLRASPHLVTPPRKKPRRWPWILVISIGLLVIGSLIRGIETTLATHGTKLDHILYILQNNSATLSPSSSASNIIAEKQLGGQWNNSTARDAIETD